MDEYEIERQNELNRFPCNRHTEAMNEYADVVGSEHPERSWILTDYDVWVPNPHFKGEHPPVPYPDFDY